MQVFDISTGVLVWGLIGGLFVLVVPAVLGTYLAVRRRRSPILGFFAGFVLSWIGILLILLVLTPFRQTPPEKTPPSAP